MNIEILQYKNKKLSTYNKFKFEIVQNKCIKKGGNEQLSLDEFEGLFDENNDEQIEIKSIDNKSSEVVVTKQLQKNKKTSNYMIGDYKDIVLSNIDKINILQEKVYAVTGIPPYRQYIYYKLSGKINTFHKLYDKNNTEIKTDIMDAIEGFHINNVPVYKDLEIYKIEPMEIFTNIDYIITQDVNTVYILDLYDVLDLCEVGDNVVDVQKVSEINENKSEIYKGLIANYWPIVNNEIFSAILSQNLQLSYPNLIQKPYFLITRYKKEKELLEDIKKKMGKINMSYKSVATETKITVPISSYIDIRILFDKIPFQENIVAIHGKLELNNEKLYLIKHREGDRIKPVILGNNSVLVQLNYDGTIIKVKFTQDNYEISTIWSENVQLTFDEIKTTIKKLINPLVKSINEKIDGELPLLDFIIGKINRMNINVYWKQVVKQDEVKKIYEIFDNLVSVKYLEKNTNTEKPEYFVIQGAKYDPFSFLSYYYNGYEYLFSGMALKQFHNLYTKKKVIKVLPRSSDIKISIIGLSEEEYYNLLSILLPLLNNLSFEKIKELKPIKKKLVKLRDEDPVLYSTKLYDNFTYSRVCQEPFQPYIYTEVEYSILKDKKNTHKYKNFTTGEDVYYKCPDNAPYFHLLTNKHPLNYCLPCCKLTPISDVNKNMFNTCMEDGKYEEKKVKTFNKYITKYGKDLQPGRLSYLPEETLEYLLFNVVDDTESCDEEFFVYGIEQRFGKHRIGLINSISHSLDVGPNILIRNIVDTINCIFPSLLSGNIYKYFDSPVDLISKLTKISLKEDVAEIAPWNKIFANILKFTKIDIIEFIDNDNGDLFINIPEGLRSVDDFIKPGNKYAIIINSGGDYHSVNYINFAKFTNEGEIAKKLFDEKDTIIKAIKQLIELYLNKNNEELLNINNVISFCKKRKYKIDYVFINFSDHCYGCLISLNKSDRVFIPLNNAFNNRKLSTKFEPFHRKKYKIDLKTSIKVIQDFYKFIKKDFEIERFEYFENEIIGYRLKDTNSFVRATYDYSKFKKDYKLLITRKDLSFVKELYYDLDECNMSIYKRKKPIDDNRTLNIDDNLYENNIYKLILLHLITKWSSERNYKKREEIEQFICKRKYKQIEINEFLKKFDDEEDLATFKKLMNRFSVHRNKNVLVKDIQNIQFNFDKAAINKIKKTDDPKKVKEIILKEIKSFSIDKSSLKSIKIPNILTTCNLPQKYCSNKKLLVSRKLVNNIAEVISYQMMDEKNMEYLLNISLLQPIIDKYKFNMDGIVISLIK